MSKCDDCKVAKYCSDKDHVIDCFIKTDLEIMAEQIRADVIEEVCELVIDYIDGYWYESEDEFKEYVKEQLREQK